LAERFNGNIFSDFEKLFDSIGNPTKDAPNSHNNADAFASNFVNGLKIIATAFKSGAESIDGALQPFRMSTSAPSFAKATESLKAINCADPINLAEGYVKFYEALENHNMYVPANVAYHNDAKLIKQALENHNFEQSNFPNIDWQSNCKSLIEQGERSYQRVHGNEAPKTSKPAEPTTDSQQTSDQSAHKILCDDKGYCDPYE
jgi:hypothetical protein